MTCVNCHERPVKVKKSGLCARCYQRTRSGVTLRGLTARAKFLRLKIADFTQKLSETEALIVLRAEVEVDRQRKPRTTANDAEALARRAERAERLWSLYQEVGTLDAVGAAEGLTRERVSQIFIKGGYSIKAYRDAAKAEILLALPPKPTREEREERNHRALLARIEANLDKSGDCWIWTGNTYTPNRDRPHDVRPNMQGYDIVLHRHKKVSVGAILWEKATGQNPRGKFLILSCFNSLCCNPAHMTLTDRKGLGEHKSPETRQRYRDMPHRFGRKAAAAPPTHCPHGHEYTEGNTRFRGVKRQRVCLVCERDRSLRYQRKKRGARGSSPSPLSNTGGSR